MRYSPIEVNLDDSQERKLKSAIEKQRGVTIRVYLTEPRDKTILFTKGQIAKIERAEVMGKEFIGIKLTAPQVKANTEHSGGFLAALAARVFYRHLLKD